MSDFEDSQQGGSSSGSSGSSGSGRFGWVRQIIGIIIVVAVVAVIFNVRGRRSTMKLTADENGVTMEYEDFSLSVKYDQIQDLDLREEYDFGTCISGGDIDNYEYGEYENAELGEYPMCITSKSDVYLVVTNKDDSHCVFNWSGTQDTRALYNAIWEIIGEDEYET